MEKRSVQAMHDRDAGRGVPRVRLGTANFLVEFLARAARARGVVRDAIDAPCGLARGSSRFDVGLRLPALEVALHVPSLSSCGGGRSATDLGNAEDRLPATEGGFLAFWVRESKAGGCKGTLGPAVVDARQVPFDALRRGVAVELVAHVNEVLDGGDVDVVDRGEVQDDCFEGGTVRVV